MKKRYIVEILLLIIALAIPFINGEKKVSLKELEEIASTCIDSTIMQQQEVKNIRKIYKIAEQEYDNYFSYGPISYMDVDEITIFEQADKIKRQQLIDKLEIYVDTKIQTFKGYGIEQTKMLEEAMIVEKGNFIICIISNDKKSKEKIIQAF